MRIPLSGVKVAGLLLLAGVRFFIASAKMLDVVAT